MAITAAALQAALGTNPNNPRVLRHDTKSDDTSQRWYVQGNVTYPGRARWCVTTASDDAATQALAVIAALKA